LAREHIPRAAAAIGYPVILKHNRAGKGLGVKLIYSEAALQEHLASDAFEDSVDGIMLLQRYIKAAEPFITRVEFINGKLLYAARIGVAGIEFIEDAQGRPYTYDVNTNTNYNPDAEAGVACKPSPSTSRAFSSSNTIRQAGSPRPPGQAQLR